ncbi:MAG: hypothetical protein B6245_14560 [Desulfobacteraceae bacterium 4572_88]|nr:MAG: hypothetical protein B6245_14560 [Desulfobacteraceae bacterium 4572_88]
MVTHQISASFFGETLTDSLGIGIIILDTDYRIVRWNYWMEKHSSVKAQDILGQHIFEIYPMIQERDKAKYIIDCMEEKRSFLLSPIIHRYLIPLDIVKNDERIQMYQNVSIFPVSENGVVSGTVIVIKDLTEQVFYEAEIARLNRVSKGIRDINKLMIRAETEKELLEETCDILVRSVGYLFAWVGLIAENAFQIRVSSGNFPDDPAHENGTYPECIGYCRAVQREKAHEYGIPETWMNTCPVIQTEKAHVIDCTKAPLLPACCSEMARKMEIQGICALPLASGGKTIGILHIFSQKKNPFYGEELKLLEEFASDISFVMEMLKHRDQHRRTEAEKAQLQAQLHQSQKIEALGTLAGGIAHDFNNILGIIMGNTEIIQMFDLPKDSPVQSRLEDILGAVYRAKDLVNQILTFCHKTEHQKEPLLFNLIGKEVLKFLRASLPATIEIRQKITNEGVSILADPTHMHQMLINLCTNAAHAMKEKGGVLEVEISETDLQDTDTVCDMELNLSNLRPGSYLRVMVRDTGHGMDPETIPRIFDPYFTTKGVGEGTGLGLALVHGIVMGHEGAITVSSTLGSGTVFQVFIPALPRQAENKADSPTQISKGHERVLFVDDEESIAKLGKSMLTYLGYKSVSLTASTEALDMFRSQPDAFDLVITDQTMPHMTGHQLSRELLRIRPDIPIILCTGFSEKISKETFAETGIRELIHKPLGIRALAEAIREVLDKD